MKNKKLTLKSVLKHRKVPLKSVTIRLFYGLKSVICIRKVGLKSVEKIVETTDITAIMQMEAKTSSKAAVNLWCMAGRKKLDYGRVRQNAVL